MRTCTTAHHLEKLLFEDDKLGVDPLVGVSKLQRVYERHCSVPVALQARSTKAHDLCALATHTALGFEGRGEAGKSKVVKGLLEQANVLRPVDPTTIAQCLRDVLCTVAVLGCIAIDVI